MNDISLRIETGVALDMNVESVGTIELGISNGRSLVYYEGGYDVVPKFVEQELATRELTMRRNVTVDSIPVLKATNIGGGYTVTIGG